MQDKITYGKDIEFNKMDSEMEDLSQAPEEGHEQVIKGKHEEEKQKILEDKNTALEQDKKKLSQLNKIDIENREIQYAKSLQNQRQLFEDQQ